MTTNAQIKANGKNAKKSTGPRSEEGKARSAKNALKHGLLARNTVLPGEDPAEFDRQLAALEADIQPANPLEFELVRQIADAQWRMRRLTRLETGFLAAALDETRRYMEKRRPDELRPGYDGETLLLGSAMLERTQAFVHLARYDGHLSRRFFGAVKQLADLRRDERKSRETRSSANSYTAADSYPGRYVPAQAPPPADTPSPTASRIGFRASSESAPQPGLTQTTKQTQFRRTPVKSTPTKDKTRSADLAFEIRGLLLKVPVAHAFLRAVSPFVATSSPVVAHALSVPRRDSSRRPGGVQPKTTKQTQFRRTPVQSTPAKDEPRSADLAFEIRGLLLKVPVAHAFLRAVSPFVATSSPVVAHALSVPRRDSSRRPGGVQPKTTKQTQFRRTPVKSTPTKDKTRSADLAFEIRGLLLKVPVAHAFLRAVSPFVATSSPEVRSGHILNRIVQVHPEHFLRHKTFSIENVLYHGKRRMRWTKKSR